MNRKSQTLQVVILLMIFSCSILLAQTTPKVKGPYLGQTPPGDTPIPFAVEFLGSDLHSGPVFSTDGKEVFWSLMDGSTGHILTSRWTDSGWSAPSEVKFSKGGPDPDKLAYHNRDYCMPSGEPCLSPDGSRLIFIAQESAATDYKEKIWVAKREGEGWGEPIQISPLINAMSIHWQLSVAENGNLYFHARQKEKRDIYCSACVDGTYQEPIALGSAINSDHDEGSPFIAPDERYLIFYRSGHDPSRKAELFISFRDSRGKWAEAKSMDKLNKDRVNELCPTVSSDGKYLFFLRNTSDGLSPFWVSASVIEDYR